MNYPTISEENYLEILKNKLNKTDIIFESAEWTSFSEKKTIGYLGDHYILKLNFVTNKNKEDATFFVKVSPILNKVGKYFISQQNFYKKEITFYKKILKEFEDMNYKNEYAPKCYLTIEENILILEDMTNKDYSMCKERFFDLEHCLQAMKSIAMLHANSFALEESKSIKIDKEYPEVNEEVLFIDMELPGKLFIEAGKNAFLTLCELLPKSQEWKDTFTKKLTNYNLTEEFSKPLPYRKTFSHGDLWSNNFLFKYQNDKPISCCLVDYQLMRYYYPAFDVISIIFSNTRKSLRDEYLQQILDHYYGNFQSILNDYGYDANNFLTKDDFLECIEQRKTLAFIQAMSHRTINLILKEVAEIFREDQPSFDFVIDPSKRARGLAVAECFKVNEDFRNIMIEFASELYELL